MVALLIIVFIVGYALIALEHKTKVDKSAVALVMCGIMWAIYIFAAGAITPTGEGSAFAEYLHANPSLQGSSFLHQMFSYVSDAQVIEHLGETAEVLFFLIGAMTIVDLIDMHGGFGFITSVITTHNKHKMLWIISAITFVMSALLDNMTTTIIMVMLLRKLLSNYKERWLFASVIVIAANSGGAWSPIGDVTTIMLWVKGNVTAGPLMARLILPCIVSVVIPVLIASRFLHGIITSPGYVDMDSDRPKFISRRESLEILILGVALLVSVPVFKQLTHLPPYMGVVTALGILWVYTDIMYKHKKNIEESVKNRVSKVLHNIDMSTILFFLGILMSVAVLQCSGVLGSFAQMLDKEVHNTYIINTLIGILSAVVDNVPLVAGAMGMYPLTDPAVLATASDAAYMSHFVQDGTFWELLAYCAGVGGSMLIIGSAAGVVAMGLEKINFMWYVKNITLMAAAGYFAGIGMFLLQEWLFY